MTKGILQKILWFDFQPGSVLFQHAVNPQRIILLANRVEVIELDRVEELID